MKAVQWIIVFQLLAGSGYGQSDSLPQQGLHLHVSAVGAIIYPGARLGVDYQVACKTITKNKGNGAMKMFQRNKFITLNTGFYYHRDFNTNLFLQGGFQWQRKNAKGWFTSVEPQLGISRTFINGEVYTVRDDGTVRRKRGAGHFYLAPAVSFGLGKDFSTGKLQRPVSVFGKLTVFTNAPYNNFVYVRLMTELGVSYHFHDLMKHPVKNRFKTK